MKKKLLSFVLAVAVVCVASSAGQADVIYGSHVDGLYKSYYIADAAQSTVNVVAGIAFDPTYMVGGSYDRIYIANRSDSNAKRGLYATYISTETTTGRLALAGDTTDNLDSPYGSAVDASGNVYVCYTGTPAVYKVVGASSGSPTETQMLKNYAFKLSGTGSDDDPVSIAMVPNGFGGSYEAGADILLFDNGLDNDYQEGLSVIDKDSLSTNQQFTVVWYESDGIDNNIRGAASEFDGYAYFVRTTLLTADDGSGNYKAYINRVNADGILQNILIDVAGGTIISTALDDSITVNPVDGSVWFAIADASSNDRYIYRLDAANASLISGNNYIASATLEITLTGTDYLNIGINDMAISPDGKLLAIGAPDDQDRIFIFNIIPEPATMTIFAFAGLFYSLKRRK